MAKPIVSFEAIEDYLKKGEEGVIELIKATEPYIKQVELIAQKMRTNQIQTPQERNTHRQELAGIYTTLNKISSATYAYANYITNSALVKGKDDYLKNPWTAEEKKIDKDGNEKINKKVITYSSTISKAEAEKEAYPYFRAACYLKSYVDAIKQCCMSFAGQIKDYRGDIENDASETESEFE